VLCYALLFSLTLLNLSIAKIDTGGNPTVLVENSDVADEYREAIARFLLDPEVVGGEQVGFLTDPTHADRRLEMIASEFCVNALRAAATLACADNPDQRIVSLETDGYSRDLRCEVTPRGDDYYCSINFSIRSEVNRLGNDLCLTVLDRIAHFTVRVDKLPTTGEIESLAGHFRAYQAVSHIPAIGFVPFVCSGSEVQIAPLIYTRSIDTNVHETACGSGSVAVALHLAQIESNSTYRIRQPSDAIYQVMLEANDKSTKATLGSEVAILFRKTISIPPTVFGETA